MLAATAAPPADAPSPPRLVAVNTTGDDELFRALRSAVDAEREQIQDHLVRRYSGLVHMLARRYARPAVDPEELRQVGYVGLVLAIQRFDPDRGVPFMGFATPTVQGEIRRYFRDKRRWIQLPRRLQEVKAQVSRAADEFTHEFGRAPTVNELAARLSLDPDDVLEAFAADDTFYLTSLDAPAGEEAGSGSIGDQIGFVDTRLDLVIDCEAVRPLIADLPERLQTILRLRFFEDRTQAEIGGELGISQMHVSRLLSKALALLRMQLAA